MKLIAKLLTVLFCASVFAAALVSTPAQAAGGKMGAMKMHTAMHAKKHSKKHHKKHHKMGMMSGKMGMMHGKKMGTMSGKMGAKKAM